MLYEQNAANDIALAIRCGYCFAQDEFLPLLAHKDGRFICYRCGHTVRHQWLALEIFLLGTGVGALLTRIALIGLTRPQPRVDARLH
jgi:hypothetical protein